MIAWYPAAGLERPEHRGTLRMRGTRRGSAPSGDTSRQCGHGHDEEHEEDDGGPSGSPLREIVPAPPGEGGHSQSGECEQLRGVTKLAKARQYRCQPPVEAAVTVAKMAVEADRGACSSGSNGPRSGSQFRSVAESDVIGQSASQPDWAGVLAQASQQADPRNHA